LLHRLSGAIFLMLAVYAGYNAYLSLPLALQSDIISWINRFTA
jgi:hypothetical protein